MTLPLPFPTEYTINNHNWDPPQLPELRGRIDRLAIDTETDGLRWWDGHRPGGISIYHPSIGAQYYPYGHIGGGNLDKEKVKYWAHQELRDMKLIFLNAKFDIHQLREDGTDLEKQNCKPTDVAHLAALLDDHRFKFSLDSLCNDILGVEKVGKDLDATRMMSYHSEEVAPRARSDAKQTWDLYEAMHPKIVNEGLEKVLELEDELIFVVCEMEKNASPIDIDKAERWKREVTRKFYALCFEISNKVGFAVNPNSPHDLKRIWSQLQLPVIGHTETGATSFKDHILKQIDHPIVDLIRQAKNCSKLLSKYLNPYSQRTHNGSIRYQLHQLRTDDGGTVSGRFSSTGYKSKEPNSDEGVNIQQILKPAKQQKTYGPDYMIRELHIPEDGLWLSADAEQIEYRLFANYAKNPLIFDRYKEDPRYSFHKMVHKELLKQVSDLTYKEVKDLNFATIYGAGLIQIAFMMGRITEEEKVEFTDFKSYNHPKLQGVKGIRDVYNKMIPEAKSLLQRVSKKAEQRGFVKTILGRRARFPDGQRTHKALNAVIQGSAADILKRKLVELHNNRNWTNFRMRFTVHDEVDGDIPSEEHSKRVAEILDEQTTPSKVPILWAVDTGKNWYECEV